MPVEGAEFEFKAVVSDGQEFEIRFRRMKRADIPFVTSISSEWALKLQEQKSKSEISFRS